MARLMRFNLRTSRVGGIVATILLLACTAGMAALLNTGSGTGSVSATSSISPSTPSGPPDITEPADIAFVTGQTGYAISWTITNKNGPIQLVQNGSIVMTGYYMNPDNVIWNVDGLAPGRYNFTLIADNSDGRSTDTVFVTISPNVQAMDGPVVGVVIGFASVGAFVVFKAVKFVPMSPSKRKDVKL